MSAVLTCLSGTKYTLTKDALSPDVQAELKELITKERGPLC